MSEKKQLNEEQLEKVSGGYMDYASDKYLPANHGIHVRYAELLQNKQQYIGKKFYCVMDKKESYYAVVQLVDVFKDLAGTWEKFTILEIPNKFCDLAFCEYRVGQTVEVRGKYYTMYAYE